MRQISAPNATWKLGSAAVLLSFAFDPLGNAPGAAALAVLTIAALEVFLARRQDDRSNTLLLALTALIIFIAALEMLHPNVPSVAVGLLGFRKSATFLLGIAIGLGWRGSQMAGLRLTWWCMFACASASIFVHLALPSVEQAILRSADKYTSLISGIARMQGILAGPFHVSMLGVFLILTSMAPGTVIQSRWLRLVAAAVGGSCVYLAQVRTGLVAVAVGVIVMILASGSARRWASRLYLLAAVGILTVINLNPLTEYANQFTVFSRLLNSGLDDTRFTARFTTWSASLDMIDASPFFGFGSGSAGDTLGQYFTAEGHVTSHNTFLKYAVEGGIFQGLLFAILCIGLAVAVRPRQDPTRFGIAAGITFLAFALVSAAPEALPISFGLAVTIGLCAQPRMDNQIDPDLGRGGRHDQRLRRTEPSARGTISWKVEASGPSSVNLAEPQSSNSCVRRPDAKT